ncbi:MAG: CAP domain-containing protein [Saprospiraceae bacterium]|nr:CAP domain-containing protein [Saprospiraceae bacterium]
MKFFFLLLPFALFKACEPATSTPSPIREAGAATPPSVDAATARAVLDEVNLLRAQGCRCPGGKKYAPAPALRWDAQLEKAAQAHADDMRQRGYFSHTSTDGTDFDERMKRAGYHWQLAGENIAKGQPTAQAVVLAWRNSKGHCGNLMNPKFEDMGVAKSGAYWVQDLGARQ